MINSINMGIFNDFFRSKQSSKNIKTVPKYNDWERYGKVGMTRRLWNASYADRQKMQALIKKHGGLENTRQMSNHQIMKMLKDEVGTGSSARDFRKRIKDKVLSRQEVVSTGPTEAQKQARILSFRYERVAEEEAKKAKGPQFANLPKTRHSVFESTKSNAVNQTGTRNTTTDRLSPRELKDNPHLGL